VCAQQAQNTKHKTRNKRTFLSLITQQINALNLDVLAVAGSIGTSTNSLPRLHLRGQVLRGSVQAQNKFVHLKSGEPHPPVLVLHVRFDQRVNDYVERNGNVRK
tara:strand:- start:175 stop:486 length:312 start_codon:yes stop_codon:yes gene_type:complete